MKDWLEKNNKAITIGLVLFIAIGGITLLYQQQQDKNTAKQNELKAETASWMREKDEMNSQMSQLEKQIADLKAEKSAPATPAPTSGTVMGSTTTSPAVTGIVNINTADATALDSLPGIGPTKAQAIIDYRNSKGGFKKLTDLKNVKGVGESTYNKLKDRISI